MRRFLLIAPFVLGACATPLSPASAQPAGGITIVPPSLPNPSAPPIPIYVPTVVCHAAVRPSVSVKPEPLGEIRLSAGDNRSVSAGDFRFQASYGDGDDRRGSGHPSFGTRIYWEPSGKLIEEVAFDQPFDSSQSGGPNGLITHDFTEHGFTGFHYVYAPSGAELQYWCTAG